MPSYAVIFISTLKDRDDASYGAMAEKMDALSRKQDGYMGIESVRGTDGRGITISYWSSLDAIKKWKANKEHGIAQSLGKSRWYKNYKVQVCRIEHDYDMG